MRLPVVGEKPYGILAQYKQGALFLYDENKRKIKKITENHIMRVC